MKAAILLQIITGLLTGLTSAAATREAEQVSLRYTTKSVKETTIVFKEDLHHQLNAVDYLFLYNDDPNKNNRTADLKAMKQGISNRKRFRKFDATGEIFEISRGPAENSSVFVGISNAEFAEFVFRNNVSRAAMIANILLTGFATEKIDFSTPEGLVKMYDSLLPIMPIPTGLLNYTLDEKFAYDHLTTEGFKLKRPCGDLDFLVESKVVAITGRTPTYLHSRFRLFMIDYSEMGEYTASFPSADGNRYMPSARAYFYLDENNKFLPLAIHIYESSLTYTPLDAPDQWAFAKLAFSAAEFNWQAVNHFFSTHVSIEPIRVETLRHLSSRHPVSAILQPIFKFIFGIPSAGYIILFQAGTAFHDITGIGGDGVLRFIQDHKELRWSDFNSTLKRLNSPGMDNIPGYKFRDDYLAIYGAMKKFISKYLKIYYKSDASVALDQELKAWGVAIASSLGGGVQAFPSYSLKTVDSLVEVIATLFADVSLLHNAMNSNVVWDTDALPAKTRALWAPLPRSKKGLINIRDFLPPVPAIVKSLTLSSAFLRPVKPQDSLLEGLDYYELGTRSSGALASFKGDLLKISAAIQAREAKSSWPYKILDPATLPYFSWV